MSILKELLKSGQLYLEDYSEKAIVLRKKPELKTPPVVYKDELISLGGKYNANLQGGSGWIFPKKKREQIEAFMEGGAEAVQKAKKKAELSTILSDIEKKFNSLSLETEKHELVENLKKMSKKLQEQLHSDFEEEKPVGKTKHKTPVKSEKVKTPVKSDPKKTVLHQDSDEDSDEESD
jgi:hypothetical protein